MKDFLFKEIINFTIFVLIIYYMGFATANVYHRDKLNIQLSELQKRYTYTDNELDQCVKRNLELRRIK